MNYPLILQSTAALIKFTNKGCGLATVDLYSGWYWTATKKGWSSISIASTNFVSGLIPERTNPDFFFFFS